jgi:hypothetical protein
MTISEFCEQRFLRYHAVSPGTRQEYGYLAKNHIVPYVGHLRISEVNRETFFNLLVNVLPAEEASQITIRATRKVLSAMCQMAFDEGYRNNPIRSIRPCLPVCSPGWYSLPPRCCRCRRPPRCWWRHQRWPPRHCSTHDPELPRATQGD